MDIGTKVRIFGLFRMMEYIGDYTVTSVFKYFILDLDSLLPREHLNIEHNSWIKSCLFLTLQEFVTMFNGIKQQKS